MDMAEGKVLASNPLGGELRTRLTDKRTPEQTHFSRGFADSAASHPPFASAAVASGQGLPMIGKLLGHTQVQTTARYAHLAADPVRTAADAVSSQLRRALG